MLKKNQNVSPNSLPPPESITKLALNDSVEIVPYGRRARAGIDNGHGRLPLDQPHNLFLYNVKYEGVTDFTV